MDAQDILSLRTYCPIKAQNAGLFISRGGATHPTRVIDSHELIFVQQGELDMWEEDRTFHLEAGYILHLWPGRLHGSSGVLPSGLRFFWIHFEVDDAGGADHSRPRERLIAPLRLPQVNHIAQPAKLEQLFRLFLEDQEMGVLHANTANWLTLLMLLEAAQPYREARDEDAESNAVASWAHTYIRINYDRPLTTGKVAKALGYNPDYLGRIYRGVYGCTITEAIHRRRVKQACRFLLDTSLTIDQIALKCGFADPDYFRRVFRRYMQISPGTYRKEYSRVHINTH